MNWYKLAQLIPIYRGEYSGNKNGNFYSFNKEFAKQFTQSGQDNEIITKFIDLSKIYDPRKENLPLPNASNEKEFDQTLYKTKQLKLDGFIVDEGLNEPNSVYVLNKSILKSI